MIILKLGNEKEFITGCSNCKSSFTYRLSDVYKEQEKLKDSLMCPVCENIILGLTYKEI